MAVPTITSVDPAEGLSKGLTVISIAGTNFRLPPAPPSGYVNGAAQQTVRVTFEGVEAENAQAASSSLILCNAPQWTGAYDAYPLSLDVRVANLDDSGVEIAGESVISADAYDIDRPKLSEETYLQRVVGACIEMFRRHVLENTSVTMHRDYSNNPVFQKMVKAQAPVIYLTGPKLPSSRNWQLAKSACEVDPLEPNGYIRKKPGTSVDIGFGIMGWTTTQRHLYSLTQAVINMFGDITKLTVDDNRHDFRMPFASFPDISTKPNLDNLWSFRSAMIVKGVQLTEDSGTIIERGRIVFANDGDPVLETETF